MNTASRSARIVSRSIFQKVQNRRLPKQRRGQKRLLGLDALESRWMPAIVTWLPTAATQNWSDAANWDSGSVPGADDDVVIPDYGTPYTVVVDTSSTVLSMNCDEGLTIAVGGRLSLQADTSVVLGDFSNYGELEVNGAGASFTAMATKSLDGGLVRASASAQAILGGVTTATNLNLFSVNESSLIRLPDMVSITSNNSFNRAQPILSALYDGQIDLANLTSIKAVGEPYNLADLTAEGPSARLNLDNLADISGVDVLQSRLGANLVLPAVANWQTPSANHSYNTDIVSIDSGSMVSLPNLTTLDSRLHALNFQASYGGSIDLPALTVATENGGWMEFDAAFGQSEIHLPALASAEHLTLSAAGDACITAPVATSANGSSVYLSGVGSVVQLDQVTSMVGGTLSLYGTGEASYPNITNADGLNVWAYGGSSLTLGGVTTATNLSLYAYDDQTKISLPNLTTVKSNNAYYWNYPMLVAEHNGTLDLPNLTAIVPVGDANMMVELGVGGANSSLNVPKLADVSGVDYLYVASGAHLTLPLVTTWQSAGAAHWSNTGVYIVGADSLLSLPNLTSIESRQHTFYFYTRSGGVAELPALTTAIRNGGDIHFEAYETNSAIHLPVLPSLDGIYLNVGSGGLISAPAATSANASHIQIQDANSTLDISHVTSVQSAWLYLYNDSSASYPLITQADGFFGIVSQGSSLALDNVVSATNLHLSASDDSSRVSMANLTTILANSTGSSVYAPSLYAYSNSTINLPKLTAIAPVAETSFLADIVLSGSGTQLKVPLLADLSGVDYLRVDSGATMTLPLVTSWQTFVSTQWHNIQVQVDGAGSVLSLPNLGTIEAATRGQLSFQAFSGGSIQLPALTSAIETGGMIAFGATQANAEVRLPFLASVENLTISASGGGLVDLPVATNASGSSISIYGATSLVHLPVALRLSGAWLTMGDSANVSLPAITNVDGLYINASSGSTLTLSGLSTATNLQVYAYNDNTQISLPNLRTVYSDYGSFRSTAAFNAESNSTVNLPELIAILPVGSPYALADLRVSGANGSLNLPKLADISGVDYIGALWGAHLSLPLVTTWQSPAANHWYNTEIQAYGDGAVLTLPNLTSIDSRYYTFMIDAFQGATIQLPALTSATANGGSVVFWAFDANTLVALPVLPSADHMMLEAFYGANLSAPLAASANGSSLTVIGPNSTLNIPGVKCVVGSSIYVAGQGDISFPNITSADGLAISAYNGACLTLAGISSATNLQVVASDSNTSVSLPNLATIYADYNQVRNWPSLYLTSNASLSLPSLTAIVPTEYAYKTADIHVAGAQTSLNVPKLADVSGVDNISLSSGGQLALPMVKTWLTPAANHWYSTELTVRDQGSTLSFPGLSLIESRLHGFNLRSYSGGAIQMPALATARQNGGSIDFYLTDSPTPGGIQVSPAGTVFQGGTVRMDLNATISGSLILTQGASLEGSGLVKGSVTNASMVNVTGAGILSISGDYTQASAGSLFIDVRGTSPGSGYEQLAVSGNASLSGRLNVESPGYSPPVGSSFNVVTAAGLSGNFQVVTLPPANSGVLLTESTSPTAVTINAIAVPVVAVANTFNTEGDLGGPAYTMAFVISGQAPAGGATINYTTTGGNPGVDYSVTSGHFTVAEGAYSQTVYVPITGNQVVQGNRTFQLQASADGVPAATGTGLIYDDDTPVTLVLTSPTAQTAVHTVFTPSPSVTLKNAYGHEVQGASVHFTVGAGSDGSSAYFAGGVSSATAVTDASGVATAPTLRANAYTGGPYTLTISGLAYDGSLVSSGTMQLTNLAAVATSIVIVSGSNQSATVNTAFAQPLQVKALDADGYGVAGVTVTFNTPSSGASGTFAGGAFTAITGLDGVATSPAFSANTVAGLYTVDASVNSLSPVHFNLVNLAGAAANMVIFSGNNQAAFMTQSYGSPLAVRITDTYGNPVSGTTVTFNAPVTGPSVAFSGGLVSAPTNAAGVATSTAFAANNIGGGFNVTATAAGLTAQSFSLTNAAPTVTSFVVQKGSIGRSFVRYADLGFNTSATLAEMVASIGSANPRIRMKNTGLDGSENVNYNLAGKIAAIDAVLALDFGAQGIGGDRNAAIGDGSYLVELDLDGNGSFETSRRFFRLLGDVNGDKVVDALDSSIVAANIGATGTNQAADVNGDGLVNATDTLLARRQRGRRITV